MEYEIYKKPRDISDISRGPIRSGYNYGDEDRVVQDYMDMQDQQRRADRNREQRTNEDYWVTLWRELSESTAASNPCVELPVAEPVSSKPESELVEHRKLKL